MDTISMLKDYRDYINVLNKYGVEVENDINIYKMENADMLVTGDVHQTNFVINKDGKYIYCGLFNLGTDDYSYIVGNNAYYVSKLSNGFVITKQYLSNSFTEQLLLHDIKGDKVLDYLQIDGDRYVAINQSFDVTGHEGVLSSYFALRNRLPKVISIEAEYQFLKYFRKSLKHEYVKFNDYYYAKTSFKIFKKPISLSYATKEELRDLLLTNNFKTSIPTDLLNITNGNEPDDITRTLVKTFYDYNKIKKN